MLSSLRKLLIALAVVNSPIESKPVSAPSLLYISVLLSRIVVLLCPVGSVIHLSTNLEECMLVLTDFESRKLLATHSLGKDSLNLRICVWLIVELLDTVVAQLTAVLSKEVVTLL